MKHLLFDLDGTLLDPARGIMASFRAGLAAVGVAAPADLGWIIGPPLRVSFPQVGVAPRDIDHALAAYRLLYREGAMFQATPYEAIAETIAALRAAGYTLHVATSKPHVFATPILQHFNLAQHFAGIFGSELDGTRDAKGDVIAHLLTTQRIAARDCLMIGDRKHDVIGARQHGIDTIGVAYGYGGRAELADAGAARIVDHARDLPAAIAALAAA